MGNLNWRDKQGIDSDSCDERETVQIRDQRKRVLNTVVHVSTIAWTMIANVVIGVFMGQWIDKRLGTQPIFLVVLSLLGVVAAIRFLFNMSRKL